MDWKTRTRLGVQFQEIVNRFTKDYTPSGLKMTAENTMLERGYPQYRGYFDGWVKMRIKRDIRTKMGKAFLKNDITIGKLVELEGQWRRLDVMSWRNGSSVTGIRAEDAEACQ